MLATSINWDVWYVKLIAFLTIMDHDAISKQLCKILVRFVILINYFSVYT